MIDLIGDIHGHADELIGLLKKMGYEEKHGVFSHSERKVLFIGDYIDRGPKIKETLRIVRAMVEKENAIALMGNHEYNAICFHMKKADGGHLRKHTINNILQHFDTLKAFKNEQKHFDDHIEWFKTLPIYFENEHFRAVHACWDENKIAYLRNKLHNNRLTASLIIEANSEETELYDAIEITLKGKEIDLPADVSFLDKDGIKRQKIRSKWWENPDGMTYQSICVSPTNTIPDIQIDSKNIAYSDFYAPNAKPVFFGHYWLKGTPMLLKNNVCCLDYSVANKGQLVAYRHQGESILNSTHFVTF